MYLHLIFVCVASGMTAAEVEEDVMEEQGGWGEDVDILLDEGELPTCDTL